ncbi:hypothetical protein EJ08DRAFT_588290, partial [Tothia fuscella]
SKTTMPKKRSHPHVSATPTPRPNIPSTSVKTVNERLSQMRAEQAPRPTLQQRQNVETVATSRSRPPELNSILNIPETPPPIPRPGSSRRWRHLRRAAPGPAAPRSWLSGSVHAHAHEPGTSMGARRKSRVNNMNGYRDRPDCFGKLALLRDGHGLPRRESLVDYTLKSMAQDWDFVSVYEQHNLPSLPVPLKTMLLSYLSIHGPDFIALEDIKHLFMTGNEIPGGTGCEEVTRLDFSGILSPSFTLCDLAKYFATRRKDGSNLAAGTESLRPSSTKVERPYVDLLESWEDEAGSVQDSIPTSLTPLRFPHLTHLSLAHPGPNASWSALLSLSTNLSTLTHLSLAYWPLPTMAPNSEVSSSAADATATFLRRSTSYLGRPRSPQDPGHDWHESANILRRLSNNTYCLRWLDFEGCNEWLPALTWTSQRTLWAGSTPPDSPPSTLPPQEKGPDWNNSWSQVTHVNVSQGFLPTDTAAVQSIPASVVACDLLLYLRERDDAEDDGYRAGPLYGSDLAQWFDKEKLARNVASAVRLARVNAKGWYCTFDYGWAPRIVPKVNKEHHGKESVEHTI